MDLKTQLETIAKNHQASIQYLETKFDRLADKQSGLPSGSLPSNTQPNPKGHNSKTYQPPQARNEHVNAIFTRSGKSYNPPVNLNDQQNNSENPINFDSDNEEEPTPQPKTKNPKPVKETPLPKPYKPKIPYPQRLRKEKMEAQYENFLDISELISNKHKIEQISAFFLSDETNLGASINLMPYSLYAKLSLETLKPTKMSVRLADKSLQYPVRIAENMLVEVGKFTFLVDFVILEMEEDSKVPLILGRPFLHTGDAVIRVKQKQLNLGEDFNALLDEGSKILHSIEGTLLEEEIFVEFDEFMAMTADIKSDSESDTEDPPFEKITINTDYMIKTSLEEPPTNLKLKPLPDNLEYVFLEEPSFLFVIISSQLSKEKKNKLVSDLKKHKQPFAWKTTDIHVVTNENDKRVPTRTVMGWRVCIYYRKLNEATAKDHFLLPFMDQMLERLTRNKYFCFLDGFSGYFQIPIDPNDQEKTTFTCPFDTYAYRRMPFGLCNAPATFQRCMLAIFHDMIEESVEVEEGIVLGHKVFSAGLEVDKAKIDVISKLPPPTNIKVDVDYVSKLAEAQALPTNDARVVVTFLKKLFCRFGMPKALISDRVENTIRALKRILEKTVKDNPAISSRKLDDALWAFRTAYKTPTETTPYKLIYGKNYHLPFEIVHRAYWALKNCNPDHIAAGEKRMFQLHELNELRHQAYENSRLYKERTKIWHDRKLRMRKEFKQGNKVLLFHSKYTFKQLKLRYRWLGPYVVKHQYPSGYVELYGKDGKTSNGIGIKLYEWTGNLVASGLVFDHHLLDRSE
nr:reverse transcriptase domain-containing protein [Tanacetum cinerariifolium]